MFRHILHLFQFICLTLRFLGAPFSGAGLGCRNFGYTIKIGQDEIHPKELQKLLEKMEDTPEEPLLSRLTLRAMKRIGISSSYFARSDAS